MSNTPITNDLFRSQWGQDKFIYENLMPFRFGKYLEVGAQDGEALSNTFFFERALDWHGILIEMQPHLVDKIKETRPRGMVFGCGLGSEEASLLYFDAGDRSGLLRYYDRYGFEELERVHQNTEPKPQYNVRWVSVRPLMDVIAETRISHIDYFSLDVEGGETAILRSIDFDRVTIDMFTIEDNLLTWAEHKEILEPQGYRWIGGLGVDGFFLHDRFIARLEREHQAGYLDSVRAKLKQTFPVRTASVPPATPTSERLRAMPKSI